jgi:hypothetical protein
MMKTHFGIPYTNVMRSAMKISYIEKGRHETCWFIWEYSNTKQIANVPLRIILSFTSNFSAVIDV